MFFHSLTSTPRDIRAEPRQICFQRDNFRAGCVLDRLDALELCFSGVNVRRSTLLLSMKRLGSLERGLSSTEIIGEAPFVSIIVPLQ